MIQLTGRILQTFATTVRCDPIFCRIDGASHPSFRFRLSNLAGRYLVFLLRLLRRSCLLVASSFTISSRNSTSDSYNTFVFVVADIPICLLPASTPNDTGCTFFSDSYCSCMVNGHFISSFLLVCYCGKPATPAVMIPSPMLMGGLPYATLSLPIRTV